MDWSFFPYSNNVYPRADARKTDMTNIIMVEIVDDFMMNLYPQPLVVDNGGYMKYHHNDKQGSKRVVNKFPFSEYL